MAFALSIALAAASYTFGVVQGHIQSYLWSVEARTEELRRRG